MSLAAAAPEVPWTDLSSALTPNGSTLDYVADAQYRGRIGVYKKSFVSGLYLVGCATSGICAPPGTDPDADITGWNTRLNAGEPYDNDPAVADILDEIKQHHSSYYIDHSEAPAPLLISNGWTDDLFPPDEAIRFYNRTRSQYPGRADLAVLHGLRPHARPEQGRRHRPARRPHSEVVRLLRQGERSGQRQLRALPGDRDADPDLPHSRAPRAGPTSPRTGRTSPRARSATARRPRRRSRRPRAIRRSATPSIRSSALAPAPRPRPPISPAPPPTVCRPRSGAGYTLMGSPTVVATVQADRRRTPRSPPASSTSAPTARRPSSAAASGGRRPIPASSSRSSSSTRTAGTSPPGTSPSSSFCPTTPPTGASSNDQQPVQVKNLHLTLAGAREAGLAPRRGQGEVAEAPPQGLRPGSRFRQLRQAPCRGHRQARRPRLPTRRRRSAARPAGPSATRARSSSAESRRAALRVAA